jgi:hypothetical protein
MFAIFAIYYVLLFDQNTKIQDRHFAKVDNTLIEEKNQTIRPNPKPLLVSL